MLLAASVDVFFRQLFWYSPFMHLLVSHVVMDNQVSWSKADIMFHGCL